jgi:hypothetical protein
MGPGFDTLFENSQRDAEIIGLLAEKVQAENEVCIS